MIRSRHPATFPAYTLLGAVLLLGLLALFAARVAHAGPAEVLHDPLTAPGGALDDLLAARHHGGWVLFVLGASVMLARIATRLPWGIGAWLSVGRRAMGVAIWSTAAGVAYDALASGGSLATVAVAVVGSLLALAHPAPGPGVTVTRSPQAGRARVGVLVILTAIGAHLAGLAMMTSCTRVRGALATGAKVALDCESPDLQAVAADGYTVGLSEVPTWLSGSGHVDTAQLKAAVSTLKTDTARCFESGVVAAVIAMVTTPPKDGPQAAALTVNPGELRAAFAAARGAWGVDSVRVAGQVL